MCVCTDKAVVDSEEGHLTGFVEQVGKSYEGIGRVQVQDQHCCDERHSLHLNTHTKQKIAVVLLWARMKRCYHETCALTSISKKRGQRIDTVHTC